MNEDDEFRIHSILLFITLAVFGWIMLRLMVL